MTSLAIVSRLQAHWRWDPDAFAALMTPSSPKWKDKRTLANWTTDKSLLPEKLGLVVGLEVRAGEETRPRVSRLKSQYPRYYTISAC